MSKKGVSSQKTISLPLLSLIVVSLVFILLVGSQFFSTTGYASFDLSSLFKSSTLKAPETRVSSSTTPSSTVSAAPVKFQFENSLADSTNLFKAKPYGPNAALGAKYGSPDSSVQQGLHVSKTLPAVIFPSTLQTSSLSKFTLNTRVYLDASGSTNFGYFPILSEYNGLENSFYILGINGNSIKLLKPDNPSFALTRALPAGQTYTGKWTQITLLVDKTSTPGKIELYENGVLVAKSSDVAHFVPSGTTYEFLVGALPVLPRTTSGTTFTTALPPQDSYFGGYIDYVEIYKNQALTPAQISQLPPPAPITPAPTSAPTPLPSNPLPPSFTFNFENSLSDASGTYSASIVGIDTPGASHYTTVPGHTASFNFAPSNKIALKLPDALKADSFNQYSFEALVYLNPSTSISTLPRSSLLNPLVTAPTTSIAYPIITQQSQTLAGLYSVSLGEHEVSLADSTQDTLTYGASSTNYNRAWTHLVWVFDKTAHTTTLYVNGQLAKTGPWTPILKPATASDDLLLGGWPDLALSSTPRSQYFVGYMDYVKVYPNTALTSQQVASAYQSTLPSTTPPAASPPPSHTPPGQSNIPPTVTPAFPPNRRHIRSHDVGEINGLQELLHAFFAPTIYTTSSLSCTSICTTASIEYTCYSAHLNDGKATTCQDTTSGRTCKCLPANLDQTPLQG